MKKLLHTTCILVIAWCLSLAGMQSAAASHLQGGQLTYISLGGNQYKFQLTVFRDCSGIAFSNIAPKLEYRTTGCIGPWPAPVPMTLVPGSQKIGDPYCATAPGGASPCGTGLATNYETGIFEATLTLPPAAEWTMSVSLSARPEVGNLVSADSKNLYFEAKLNNLVGGRTIVNTSPQYEQLNAATPFVCWKQDTQISFATTEPDGDSLVYSLETPLNTCSDPLTYERYTSTRFILVSEPPVCVADLGPNTSGLYSSTFPLPSYSFTGPACPAIRTAVPTFAFNPTLGTMTFTPALFTPGNTTALQAKNKYAVVGKVTEWRRLTNANGTTTAYKVGSVRRDMFIVVIDCNSNLTPGPPIATGGPKTGVTIVNSRDSTFITAYTCNYTEVRLRFSDPNPTDLLKVTYPELDPPVPTPLKPTYLPEDVATFQLLGNNTKTPAAILRIQPDVAFIGRTFRIPVKIEDNGCPVKGTTYRTIVLKIEKGNFAKVVPSTSNPFVCAGSGAAVTLSASPFRPDSVGNMPAQYGYRWAAANGLNPADSTKQTLSVRPTQTTRYKVRILGLSFRAGTCQDTASVLVRVVPLPVVRAVASKTLVCAGEPAVISATATRTDNNQAVYSYQWQPANGLTAADLDKQNITVRPTATTRYKLTVSSLNNLGCGDTTSVVVRVAPTLNVAFKADSAATSGRSIMEPPIQFTFTNQSRATGALPAGTVSQYKWSYQRLFDSKGQPVFDKEVTFSTDAAQAPLLLSIAGVYRIKLTAAVALGTQTGAESCKETVMMLNVRVPDVKTPNVFTPNGDGLNDTFVIQTEQTGNKMQIFNRWGRKIRDYENYKNEWNGDEQPAGVYYYLITDRNGNTSKGWVELAR
ncbi:gliding motility-associated C-terminal domain-containing protein [Hymenobacter daecheongensis DSM 21074]|uniref:Gliding motility-associated C-terminal domain-containing protein n=1 Tax=Hymenobacter daecheongensis DSM 21074 TaxID=1121955 RepID=A0A1M6LJ49_9BACT|nr:gliding motility-associated C-terminal domain-containing protein [Hymenobacter daecheongensis]SHJ71236.1 gliding motility-associated C-terminal domain-containing protein [Hymenobacter daecheongensis DSM 21074]